MQIDRGPFAAQGHAVANSGAVGCHAPYTMQPSENLR
jgi:hypothetical protein